MYDVKLLMIRRKNVIFRTNITKYIILIISVCKKSEYSCIVKVLVKIVLPSSTSPSLNNHLHYQSTFSNLLTGYSTLY